MKKLSSNEISQVSGGMNDFFIKTCLPMLQNNDVNNSEFDKCIQKGEEMLNAEQNLGPNLKASISHCLTTFAKKDTLDKNYNVCKENILNLF